LEISLCLGSPVNIRCSVLKRSQKSRAIEFRTDGPAYRARFRQFTSHSRFLSLSSYNLRFAVARGGFLRTLNRPMSRVSIVMALASCEFFHHPRILPDLFSIKFRTFFAAVLLTI